MTSPTPVQFTWQGISFVQGMVGPHWISSISGWDDPPDAQVTDQAVPGRHGARKGRLTRRARTVTLEGTSLSRSARDDLFNQLVDAMAAGFGDGDNSSPLVGSVAGRTLTADAQLQRFAPKVEQSAWAQGVFGWAIQWRCPDPMRYGAPTTIQMPIRVQELGITFPVTGSWAFPVDPAGGQARANNAGNALADAVYTLRGPLAGPGVALIEPGKRVRVDFDLGADDELVIDTAAGLITLNGQYRASSVDSALLDEMRLPPSTTTTVQALGTPQAGSPFLSVSTCPTYW